MLCHLGKSESTWSKRGPIVDLRWIASFTFSMTVPLSFKTLAKKKKEKIHSPHPYHVLQKYLSYVTRTTRSCCFVIELSRRVIRSVFARRVRLTFLRHRAGIQLMEISSLEADEKKFEAKQHQSFIFHLSAKMIFNNNKGNN